MKVFIEGVDGYVGRALIRALEQAFSNQEGSGVEGEISEQKEVIVVGSVAEDEAKPSGVSEVVPRKDLEAVASLARSADAIVLDAHESVMEASAIVKELKKPFQGQKSLVLLSTLLTWDNTPGDIGEETKDADNDGEGKDGEMKSVFTENMFTRRKPSPNFLVHKTLESQVISLAHEMLSTTVLASGLLYGDEQGPFHEFFRDAWLGKELKLPKINSACSNMIPTVHVRDLAKATCKALSEAPNQQYVVVADESKNSLADIAIAIFSVLQPDEAIALMETEVPPEDEEESTRDERERKWIDFKKRPRFVEGEESDILLLENPGWTQLQCDLQFDTSEGAIQSLLEEWHCKEGIVDKMPTIVREFKASRNLKPVKLVTIGPPASGIAQISKFASENYYLPLISLDSATEEIMLKLAVCREEREMRLFAHNEEKKASEERDGEQTDEEENKIERKDEEEDETRLAILKKSAWEKLAEKIEASVQDKKKRGLDDDLKAKIVRAKLLSSACQNQGYVLDGVELSYQFMKKVFSMSAVISDEDDFEEDAKESKEQEHSNSLDETVVDPRIIPNGVICLDAKDEFLRAVARASGDFLEQDFKKELKFFRDNNAIHIVRSAIAFFEGNCRIESLLVQTDRHIDSEVEGKKGESFREEDLVPSFDLNDITLYIEKGRKPFNYRPTEEEKLELARKEKEERLAREKRDRETRAEEEIDRRAGENERIKALEEHRKQAQAHEEALLQARSEPLRNYLMESIMPALSKALVETCSVQPDDPVDFLADYLFKHAQEQEQDLD